MGIHGIDGGCSRRVLYARIEAGASEADVRRAERLLLRGLEREWPEMRIARLLQALLARAAPRAQAGDRR